MAKNEKRQPICERVAEMFGKTSFRDIRDGFGGTPQLSIPSVATALGLVQQRRGELAVQVLETYYGSTLIHERDLRRAWDATGKDREYSSTVLVRMGAALAIRRFAGMDYTSEQLGEYAWIIRQRKDTLQGAVRVAKDWLDDLWMQGLGDLRAAFGKRVA